jgi:hypothetical protein
MSVHRHKPRVAPPRDMFIAPSVFIVSWILSIKFFPLASLYAKIPKSWTIPASVFAVCKTVSSSSV